MDNKTFYRDFTLNFPQLDHKKVKDFSISNILNMDKTTTCNLSQNFENVDIPKCTYISDVSMGFFSGSGCSKSNGTSSVDTESSDKNTNMTKPTKDKIQTFDYNHKEPEIKKICTIDDSQKNSNFLQFGVSAILNLHQTTDYKGKNSTQGNTEKKCITSNVNTQEYYQNINSSPNVIKCYTCDKTFKTKATLERHMPVHTGVRAFICNICNKKFKQSSTLSRHKIIHTGIKVHKCPQCQQSFNRKSTLTTHLKLHFGRKEFVCVICKRAFFQKGNLKNHLKIHMIES